EGGGVGGVGTGGVVEDGGGGWAAGGRAAYLVQFGGGPRSGPADSGPLRRRAPGDYLHSLLRVRLSLELGHGLPAARGTASRRGYRDARCLGGDLRLARGAPALRE